jgi:hypothetical protein
MMAVDGFSEWKVFLVIIIFNSLGVYTVGWLKRGPSGNIASCVGCSNETALSVFEDSFMKNYQLKNDVK